MVGGSEFYGTASDNATASNLTAQSDLYYSGNGDDDFACQSGTDWGFPEAGDFYPATTVTLPFATPAQGPIQF